MLGPPDTALNAPKGAVLLSVSLLTAPKGRWRRPPRHDCPATTALCTTPPALHAPPSSTLDEDRPAAIVALVPGPSPAMPNLEALATLSG